jgi:N-methylhydantoinase A/oxoprolinase/acetone carboxylase beta subunit
MSSTLPPCVVGIDVGGTNTDRFVGTTALGSKLLTKRSSVILQNGKVIAWHKTPTTPDIQNGVELAIEAVVKKAGILPGQIDSVKIGTTVSAFPLVWTLKC